MSADEKTWAPATYTAADADEVMALFRTIWGDIEPAQPAYHRWQYAAAPAGPAAATIARDAATGQVVGHEATIPIEMSVAGNECLASLALNSSTLSEWRGQGVFSGLIRAACEVARERGISFIYGFPNEQAYGPRVKHCGYKDVGSVPLLVRPLNPRALARKVTDNRFLSWLAWPAGLLFREPAGRTSDDFRVEAVDRFDSSFDRFWDRVKGRYPVMVLRDSAYLNWRFVDIPVREYVRLAASSDGQVKAFIVLRLADIRGLDAGLIVDFLTEPSAQGRAAGRALVDAAFAHFRGRRLDLLASLSLSHTEENRLLRSKGFRALPRFLQPQPFPLVVYCNRDDEACRLASDLRNWFVTMGDYDVT